MGKQMVRAAPAVLKKLMSLRHVTQAELAQQVDIDVKTLRAILNGEEVKDVTLKKLALKFGFPVEHLMSDLATPQKVQDDSSQQFDTHDTVALKRTTPALLKDILTNSNRIEWSLDLPLLSGEMKKELLRFEECVSNWHKQLQSEPVLLGSLRTQIERLESSTEIHNFIEALNSKSITVFAGQYSHWSREEQNYYEELWTVSYESIDIALIALRPSSVTVVSIPVDRGEMPPRTFRHIRMPVHINGHEVWDGRSGGPFSREVDDEVPF
jgi:transcriptional regulator with XRE-family HTH domain